MKLSILLSIICLPFFANAGGYWLCRRGCCYGGYPARDLGCYNSSAKPESLSRGLSGSGPTQRAKPPLLCTLSYRPVPLVLVSPDLAQGMLTLPDGTKAEILASPNGLRLEMTNRRNQAKAISVSDSLQSYIAVINGEGTGHTLSCRPN